MTGSIRSLLVGFLLAACGTSRPQVAPDAPDPCDKCGADQLCVQLYDGTCTLDTQCVPRAASCHDPSLTEPVCSTACQAAYCVSPYRCTDRMGCGSPLKVPSPKAFTCYGP